MRYARDTETRIEESALNDAGRVLRDAAEIYKVDVAAITTKVKQEFATTGGIQDRWLH